MTIDSATPPPAGQFDTKSTTGNKEHIIQGAPVKVYITMPENGDAARPNVEDFVKEKLADLLAKEILKNKLCEFTKEIDANRFNVIYRARAFLTPNDQVRLLRENNKL